jgi:hypothetical protein
VFTPVALHCDGLNVVQADGSVRFVTPAEFNSPGEPSVSEQVDAWQSGWPE